jgi:hypothetical protein
MLIGDTPEGQMNGKHTHRVVTFLSREQLEFLDKLEKDMMFSTGKHISRSQIIQDLAELLARTHMDGTGIVDNEELQKRIFEAIVRMKDF